MAGVGGARRSRLERTATMVTSEVQDLSAPSPRFAGFFQRLLALVIDGFLLGLFGQALGIVIPGLLSRAGAWGWTIGFTIVVSYFGVLNSRIGGGSEATASRSASADPPCAPSCSRLHSFSATLPSTSLYPCGLPLSCHMWLSGRGSRSSICSSSIDPLGSRCMTDSSARSLSPSTRWSPPGPGNIWWGHRAVVAVIVMLAVVVPIGVRQLGRTELFTSLLTAQQAISKEPGVAFVRIGAPTVINIEDGRRSSRQVLFVGVVLLPGATDPAAMANKVVRIVLDTAPEAASMDEITVLLSKGYDIGIASLTETRELSLSPSKWRERVGS